mgnify:CR=1 FL=1
MGDPGPIIETGWNELINISVRPIFCSEDDLNQLIAIERASFNQYDAYSLVDFKRWLQYNPDLCLAAEMNGKIVGYVISRIHDGVCDLASMAVANDFRHCGIGQVLLEAIEKSALNYGMTEIDLEVRTTNLGGQSFWQKMNFVPFGKLSGFYEDGGDAIRMRKIIIPMGY